MWTKFHTRDFKVWNHFFNDPSILIFPNPAPHIVWIIFPSVVSIPSLRLHHRRYLIRAAACNTSHCLRPPTRLDLRGRLFSHSEKSQHGGDVRVSTHTYSELWRVCVCVWEIKRCLLAAVLFIFFSVSSFSRGPPHMVPIFLSRQIRI